MKYKIVLVIIISIMSMACMNEEYKKSELINKSYGDENQDKKKSLRNDDSLKLNTMEQNDNELDIAMEEFKILYLELMKIKNNEDFLKYGFSKGGPYYNWMERIKKLKASTSLLIKKGLVVGELEMLGHYYVASEGTETEITKFFNDEISKILASE